MLRERVAARPRGREPVQPGDPPRRIQSRPTWLDGQTNPITGDPLLANNPLDSNPTSPPATCSFHILALMDIRKTHVWLSPRELGPGERTDGPGPDLSDLRISASADPRGGAQRD
jgi:hypothetical protein